MEISKLSDHSTKNLETARATPHKDNNKTAVQSIVKVQ